MLAVVSYLFPQIKPVTNILSWQTRFVMYPQQCGFIIESGKLDAQQRKCKCRVGTYMDHSTVMKYCYVLLLKSGILVWMLYIVKVNYLVRIVVVLTGLII